LQPRAFGLADWRSCLKAGTDAAWATDRGESIVQAMIKGEASNALRRTVFFHHQDEIRDCTFENQGFRASGLSLITAAIVHWNTVYLHRAVQHGPACLPGCP